MLSDCVKKVIFWVSPVTFVLFGFQNLEAMRSISLFQAVGVAADAEPDSIHLSGFSAGILEGSSTLLIIIPELLCVQLIPVRKLCLRNKHMVAILLTKKAFLNLFVNYALEFWCWLLFCFFFFSICKWHLIWREVLLMGKLSSVLYINSWDSGLC